MDYNYESLLDQRFQKLCQALLLKEYKNVQCFPVGMADGGRDATSNIRGNVETVFQVKFTHKPGSIRNVAKWVTDTLDGELEKILKLKEKGATRYVLITNAFPTGKMDSGTIDKVSSYMAEKIPMEGICWWRDDLDRRLDNNYDVKLAYPSLMSGTDLLRLMWENMGPNEDAQRRKMALSAYFAHQAEQDSTIRFKQAELLPSSLLELFIDVPAVPHNYRDAPDSQALESYLELLYAQSDVADMPLRAREVRRRLEYVRETRTDGRAKVHPNVLSTIIRDMGTSIGAADLLLNEQFLDKSPFIVLEGAPGQGKSTLSQYLAQLQRLRILDRTSDVSKISSSHASSPVMLPFKIELRDLASWMKGLDPWSSNPADRHNRPRTLEGAISGHVERYSGGIKFDVSDMAFVAQSHPVLVILDALDEVADLEDRHRVVEEVVAAVSRLAQGSKTLKMLVTSRPTAVTGAPSFPKSRFDYLTLAAIPPELGLEYAQKWSRARNLRRADALEISEILKQKMSAPHMAELAKNTMQLSILLSLIYHRGSSLPDKRTELYDAYVDSFFNREVEKSKIVRENRMMLIGIHQHLAFYMHARAENNKTTGRISLDELRHVVGEYLVKQRESVAVLDILLTGMVERVVALVSRVEGTYEFEVQPLREYFAARYLYDTAPYVPATRAGHGTKPDRFDGIAKNSYWMNVTRFFAGCFTMGELLDLAERVCKLFDLPEMEGKAYPRNLALALLQDWVFSQSKPATEKVIDKLYEAYGVRSIYISDSLRGRLTYSSVGNSSLSLSNETGSTYFIESRGQDLFRLPYSEDVRALSYVLGKQPQKDRDLLRKQWQECYRAATSERRIELLHIGRWANLFHPDMDLSLFSEEQDLSVLLAMVDIDFTVNFVADSMHRSVAVASLNDANQFSVYSSASALSNALSIAKPVLWHYSVHHEYDGAFLVDHPGDVSSSETIRTLRAIGEPLFSQTQSFHSDFGFWRDFLRKLEEAFGSTWAGTLIGLVSASVRAPRERGAGADSLFSSEYAFCDRVRNARRRGSQVEWWSEQLQAARTREQKELWVATAYCHASGDVLSALFEGIDSALADLPKESLDRLFVMASNRDKMSARSYEGVVFPISWLRQIPLTSPTLSLFFDRIEDGPQKDRLLSKRVPGAQLGREFLFSMLRYAWKRWAQGFLTEKQILTTNKKLYLSGVFTPSGVALSSSLDRKVLRASLEKLIAQGENMPDMILSYVESELRRTAKRPRPVLRVAEKEKWFN